MQFISVKGTQDYLKGDLINIRCIDNFPGNRSLDPTLCDNLRYILWVFKLWGYLSYMCMETIHLCGYLETGANKLRACYDSSENAARSFRTVGCILHDINQY